MINQTTRRQRGIVIIVAVLALNVLIVAMMIFHLVLRKHRQHTTRSTIDPKNYFATKASHELAQQRIIDAGGATWNPGVIPAPFNVTVDSDTVVTVTILDDGF